MSKHPFRAAHVSVSAIHLTVQQTGHPTLYLVSSLTTPSCLRDYKMNFGYLREKERYRPRSQKLIQTEIPKTHLHYFLYTFPLTQIMTHLSKQPQARHLQQLPFSQWSCGLELHSARGSSEVTSVEVRRSIFPVWSRNCLSSWDRRLNCSVWLRHCSSRSFTRAWQERHKMRHKPTLKSSLRLQIAFVFATTLQKLSGSQITRT